MSEPKITVVPNHNPALYKVERRYGGKNRDRVFPYLAPLVAWLVQAEEAKDGKIRYTPLPLGSNDHWVDIEDPDFSCYAYVFDKSTETWHGCGNDGLGSGMESLRKQLQQDEEIKAEIAKEDLEATQ